MEIISPFQRAYRTFHHVLKRLIRSTLKRANDGQQRGSPSAKSAGLATLRGSHLKMAGVSAGFAESFASQLGKLNKS